MKPRPIKFMAWQKPTRKMFPVYGFNEDFVFEDTLDGPGTSETIPANRIDCVLLQFTGLLDSKGNEVYEGHIVKSAFASNVPRGTDVVYNEVAFRDGCFGIVSELDQKKLLCCAETNFTDYSTEVVGNVFEHSDLLAVNDSDVWDDDRFKSIPDVEVIQVGNLCNWLEYEYTIRQMQKADGFIQSSIDSTDWMFIREEFYNNGISAKEAFKGQFYEE